MSLFRERHLTTYMTCWSQKMVHNIKKRSPSIRQGTPLFMMYRHIEIYRYLMSWLILIWLVYIRNAVLTFDIIYTSSGISLGRSWRRAVAGALVRGLLLFSCSVRVISLEMRVVFKVDLKIIWSGGTKIYGTGFHKFFCTKNFWKDWIKW